MRVLFVSNSVWSLTGYGQQSRYILSGFKRLGHQVAQLAFYGLAGGHIEIGDIPIYPPYRDAFGSDIVGAHAKHFKADAVMALLDIWVLPSDYASRCGVPFIPYFPVDSIPPVPKTVQVARNADYPVVYSRFGEAQMDKAGVECSYIPHGVDCSIFKPGDKQEARRKLGLPSSAFIVSMVAANKDYPSRKAFPENLQAFARFQRSHPEAILYLHTDYNRAGTDGVDLLAVIESLEIPPDAIRFPDQQRLVYGISDSYMARIYQASDVLLASSMSEGFGLPILEAQASGCPVITTDFSAMKELTVNGILTAPAQLFWIPLGCWQAMVSVDNVAGALERFYQEKEQYQSFAPEAARIIKTQYDWPVVMNDYWKPFLERVGNEIKGSQVASNRMRRVTTNGVTLSLYDRASSWTIECVREELERDVYGIEGIEFKPGDTVIDIGANVGMVSIYLAKKYPFIRILAFEPVEENFNNLMRNLALNNVPNVEAYNLAVTSDGRAFAMSISSLNTGGASGYAGNGKGCMAESITLDQIFKTHSIQSCALLKIDCEGAEYEILKSADCLNRIAHIGAEFHATDDLIKQGHTVESLLSHLSSFIPLDNVRYTSVHI